MQAEHYGSLTQASVRPAQEDRCPGGAVVGAAVDGAGRGEVPAPGHGAEGLRCAGRLEPSPAKGRFSCPDTLLRQLYSESLRETHE